jgi:hypothetical protein
VMRSIRGNENNSGVQELQEFRSYRMERNDFRFTRHPELLNSCNSWF